MNKIKSKYQRSCFGFGILKSDFSNAYSGAITIGILIWATVIIVVIYAIGAYIALQYDFSFRQIAGDQSLFMAEAGIDYYRWHLAHAPGDFKDGQTGSGPYLHDYKDPQGKTLGKFSLEITPPANGSSIVTIVSTGWKTEYPEVKKTVTASYGIPSMAQYAFLSNAASWYGAGITVHGLIHSNSGIRMDGANDSLVTSALATYTCGQETGCSPSQTKPGVWGGGGPADLWQYPVVPVDFSGISADFTTMRSAAQASGLYYPASGSYGYHLVFNSNGTVTVYRVTRVSSVNGYSVENRCQSLGQNITRQTALGTYQIAQKPIIFVEDYLWVEGIINGKTTVVAARFPIANNNMNIWIISNLRYLDKSGSHALGLIAQKDIYYGLNIPSDFEVNGALLAQNGRIIRHGYAIPGCSNYGNAVRNSLLLYGAVITNQKSYWNFGSPPVSGFRTRSVNYDPGLNLNPPPYFPSSGSYEIISWRE